MLSHDFCKWWWRRSAVAFSTRVHVVIIIIIKKKNHPSNFPFLDWSINKAQTIENAFNCNVAWFINWITCLFCYTTQSFKKLHSEINVSWPIYSYVIHMSEKKKIFKGTIFGVFRLPPSFLQCVSVVEAQDFVGKSEIRLMFHEDHGEFILMGVLTLNHVAMIFS